jgi:hypothetical protein
MATRSLLTIARRNMSSFTPKDPKPLPVGTNTVWLSPSRVRPAHWTEADIAALPPAVEKPNLNKGKYMAAAPLAIPAVVAYGFFLFNNATGIYNDRMNHQRPY